MSEEIRPTVWLVNDAGHDTRDAERFGRVQVLSVGNLNPLRVDRAVWHFAKGIARYTHKDDYLCIMGTPTLNAIAVLLWMLQYRQCKLLQWNAKKRRYEQSILSTEHLLNILDAAIRG